MFVFFFRKIKVHCFVVDRMCHQFKKVRQYLLIIKYKLNRTCFLINEPFLINELLLRRLHSYKRKSNSTINKFISTAKWNNNAVAMKAVMKEIQCYCPVWSPICFLYQKWKKLYLRKHPHQMSLPLDTLQLFKLTH